MKKPTTLLDFYMLILVLSFGMMDEAFAQSERFAGYLVSSDGSVLQGKVSVNSVTATTKADGSFELYVPRASPYRISASARNHASYSDVHYGPALGNMRIRLLAAEGESFDPAQAFDKTDSRGTRLQIPAGALVDANGNPPTALVTVHFHTYELGSEQLLGDMTALDSGGLQVAVRGRGAVMVGFSDESGSSMYNLAAGKKATLSLVVPTETPATIPVWWYDTQEGIWREEGTFSVENGVATGEVSHFTVWQAGLREAAPACIRIQLNRTWFASQGYGSLNPLKLVAQVRSPDVRVITLNLASVGDNVLYNLAPNSRVEFFVDGKSQAIIKAGDAWGGTGRPASPYTSCKNSVLFDGKAKVGTIKGRALRQHRTNHVGIIVNATVGTETFSSITDANGNFSVVVPLGTAMLNVSRAGYLSAQRDSVEVVAEQVVTLSSVTLLAGNVDGSSSCVDVSDMKVINNAIPLNGIFLDVTGDDERDVDGDMKIGFSDLKLAAINGKRCNSPWAP